jgi:putative FmdB family regulatory protein
VRSFACNHRAAYPSSGMPIYEYECDRCARISSHVVMGANRKPRVACPHCGSRTRRVMSSFAVVETEASRVGKFDTGAPRNESFYRDPRNVGLWAKKRAQQMGVDLGDKFEATVEKARSGKLVKEMM